MFGNIIKKRVAAWCMMAIASISTGATMAEVKPESVTETVVSPNLYAQKAEAVASSISWQDMPQPIIKVYVSQTDAVEEMYLDEYIKGVILAEMPLYYDIEALKAQAVAARSYTLYRIDDVGTHKVGAIICTDYNHCQAWRDPSCLLEVFGETQGRIYADKLEEAVTSTQNVVATYKGEIINAMYFSNSGGYTENIEDVWTDCSFDYLRSVASPGETAASDYITFKTFTVNEFRDSFLKYGIKFDCSDEVLFGRLADIKRSDTGRILTMSIDGRAFVGITLRKILGLRSTILHFNILDDGRLMTVAFGYGHGVGMSQVGAGAMAAKGESYENILKYYYTGIEVEWAEASLLENLLK